MLLLSTSLFSMEHKNHNMQEMNHQNHNMKETSNVNSNIPSDAKCHVCGMFVAKYANWAATIKTDKETFYFDGVKDMMKFYFEPTKYSKDTKKMIEQQFEKLKRTYNSKQIMDIVLNLDNFNDAPKKYTNVNRTITNWLQREDNKLK